MLRSRSPKKRTPTRGNESAFKNCSSYGDSLLDNGTARKAPGASRGAELNQDAQRPTGQSFASITREPGGALSAASARATQQALGFVVAAADRLAAGYGLAWSDYDRLHRAHQHLIAVLATDLGREVLQ